MASTRMIVACVLGAVLCIAAGDANPCGTAPPSVTPTPTPAPANPCATVAPRKTCAGFKCASNYVIKGGVVLCGNKDGPACSTTTCCAAMPTTVTTTPAPTCASTGFKCTAGQKAKAMTVICAGKCNTVQCCDIIPTTVTTTPAPTVTTTPAPTCVSSSFACPSGQKAKSGAVACVGKCNTVQCCDVILTTVTTTPAATVTTTPAPNPCSTAAAKPTLAATPAPTPAPTQANPCGTAPPARLYNAKDEIAVEKAVAPRAAVMPAWAMPLLGVAAFFLAVSMVAVARKRFSGASPSAQSVFLDEESLLEPQPQEPAPVAPTSGLLQEE